MRRRDSLRALLALPLGALARPVLAFDLDALMALLAKRQSGEARFTEQRFVGGLDAPLVSSGTLSFRAPDRFARRTLEPRAETMAVDGNELTLTRGGRSRRLALDATPELVALVESVRGTLTGNAALLRRYFRPTLAGGAAAWTLDLEPLEAGLGAVVRGVRIAGHGGELRSIEMRLVGGDHTVMSITPLPAAAASAP